MRSRVGLALAAGLFMAACSGGSGLSADAGEDFAVSVGEAPEFVACDSTGDISNYEWTISAAPEARPESVGQELRAVMADCSFVLESQMVLDDVGEWTIDLTITDGTDTATDQVVVTVNP